MAVKSRKSQSQNKVKVSSKLKVKSNKKAAGSSIRTIQCAILLLLVTIFGTSLLIYAIDSHFLFKPKFTISQILFGHEKELRELLSVIDGQLELVDTNSRKRIDENVDSIIKTRLRRVQTRLSSLKAQTIQYEKMTVKVPGGPGSFISSTTLELEHLTRELALIDVEIFQIKSPNLSLQDAKSYEHPVQSFILPKVQLSMFQEEEIALLGNAKIFLWPDSWFGEDLDEAGMERNFEEAMNSNVTLIQCFQSLENSTRILKILADKFQQLDELWENIQYNFYIKTSPYYTQSVAKILFFFPYLRGGERRNMTDFDLLIETMPFPEVEEHVEKMKQYVNARKDCKSFYAQNEGILRSVMPMEYIFPYRFKKFVDEDNNKNGVASGSLSNAWGDLRAQIFKDLRALRERVLKLKD